MSNRFLNDSSSVDLNTLKDGSFDLNVSSLQVQSLMSNGVCLTSIDKTMQATDKLPVDRIDFNFSGLITTPYSGTLQATTLASDNIHNVSGDLNIVSSGHDVKVNATTINLHGDVTVFGDESHAGFDVKDVNNLHVQTIQNSNVGALNILNTDSIINVSSAAGINLQGNVAVQPGKMMRVDNLSNATTGTALNIETSNGDVDVTASGGHVIHLNSDVVVDPAKSLTVETMNLSTLNVSGNVSIGGLASHGGNDISDVRVLSVTTINNSSVDPIEIINNDSTVNINSSVGINLMGDVSVESGKSLTSDIVVSQELNTPLITSSSDININVPGHKLYYNGVEVGSGGADLTDLNTKTQNIELSTEPGFTTINGMLTTASLYTGGVTTSILRADGDGGITVSSDMMCNGKYIEYFNSNSIKQSSLTPIDEGQPIFMNADLDLNGHNLRNYTPPLPANATFDSVSSSTVAATTSLTTPIITSSGDININLPGHKLYYNGAEVSTSTGPDLTDLNTKTQNIELTTVPGVTKLSGAVQCSDISTGQINAALITNSEGPLFIGTDISCGGHSIESFNTTTMKTSNITAVTSSQPVRMGSNLDMNGHTILNYKPSGDQTFGSVDAQYILTPQLEGTSDTGLKMNSDVDMQTWNVTNAAVVKTDSIESNNGSAIGINSDIDMGGRQILNYSPTLPTDPSFDSVTINNSLSTPVITSSGDININIPGSKLYYNGVEVGTGGGGPDITDLTTKTQNILLTTEPGITRVDGTFYADALAGPIETSVITSPSSGIFVGADIDAQGHYIGNYKTLSTRTNEIGAITLSDAVKMNSNLDMNGHSLMNYVPSGPQQFSSVDTQYLLTPQLEGTSDTGLKMNSDIDLQTWNVTNAAVVKTDSIESNNGNAIGINSDIDMGGRQILNYSPPLPTDPSFDSVTINNSLSTPVITSSGDININIPGSKLYYNGVEVGTGGGGADLTDLNTKTQNIELSTEPGFTTINGMLTTASLYTGGVTTSILRADGDGGITVSSDMMCNGKYIEYFNSNSIKQSSLTPIDEGQPVFMNADLDLNGHNLRNYTPQLPTNATFNSVNSSTVAATTSLTTPIITSTGDININVPGHKLYYNGVEVGTGGPDITDLNTKTQNILTTTTSGSTKVSGTVECSDIVTGQIDASLITAPGDININIPGSKLYYNGVEVGTGSGPDITDLTTKTQNILLTTEPGITRVDGTFYADALAGPIETSIIGSSSGGIVLGADIDAQGHYIGNYKTLSTRTNEIGAITLSDAVKMISNLDMNGHSLMNYVPSGPQQFSSVDTQYLLTPQLEGTSDTGLKMNSDIDLQTWNVTNVAVVKTDSIESNNGSAIGVNSDIDMGGRQILNYSPTIPTDPTFNSVSSSSLSTNSITVIDQPALLVSNIDMQGNDLTNATTLSAYNVDVATLLNTGGNISVSSTIDMQGNDIINYTPPVPTDPTFTSVTATTGAISTLTGTNATFSNSISAPTATVGTLAASGSYLNFTQTMKSVNNNLLLENGSVDVQKGFMRIPAIYASPNATTHPTTINIMDNTDFQNKNVTGVTNLTANALTTASISGVGSSIGVNCDIDMKNHALLNYSAVLPADSTCSTLTATTSITTPKIVCSDHAFPLSTSTPTDINSQGQLYAQDGVLKYVYNSSVYPIAGPQNTPVETLAYSRETFSFQGAGQAPGYPPFNYNSGISRWISSNRVKPYDTYRVLLQGSTIGGGTSATLRLLISLDIDTYTKGDTIFDTGNFSIPSTGDNPFELDMTFKITNDAPSATTSWRSWGKLISKNGSTYDTRVFSSETVSSTLQDKEINPRYINSSGTTTMVFYNMIISKIN